MSLTQSKPIVSTNGIACLTEKRRERDSGRERDGKGGRIEVWLTSLILFPHTDAFQIDLHTAQRLFSLDLAVMGALECTRPEKTKKQ